MSGCAKTRHEAKSIRAQRQKARATFASHPIPFLSMLAPDSTEDCLVTFTKKEVVAFGEVLTNAKHTFETGEEKHLYQASAGIQSSAARNDSLEKCQLKRNG